MKLAALLLLTLSIATGALPWAMGQLILFLSK